MLVILSILTNMSLNAKLLLMCVFYTCNCVQVVTIKVGTEVSMLLHCMSLDA